MPGDTSLYVPKTSQGRFAYLTLTILPVVQRIVLLNACEPKALALPCWTVLSLCWLQTSLHRGLREGRQFGGSLPRLFYVQVRWIRTGGSRLLAHHRRQIVPPCSGRPVLVVVTLQGQWRKWDVHE